MTALIELGVLTGWDVRLPPTFGPEVPAILNRFRQLYGDNGAMTIKQRRSAESATPARKGRAANDARSDVRLSRT